MGLFHDMHALVSAVSDDILSLEPFFAGSYRFGPRSTIAAIMALSARCLVDSYEESLDFVYDRWGASVGWERAPAKSGLSRARAVLGVEPMREMWQRQLGRARSVIAPLDYGFPEDRRAVAIDGSWMLLPESEGVRKRWSQAGRPCTTVPQALLVAAVETTQRVPVAATVVGLNVGEREAATTLLKDLQPSDILLFDRGYPGRAFVGTLIAAGHDLVMRMVVGPGGFTEINDFWNSNRDEAIVSFSIHGNDPVPMRLIRRRFPRGRPRNGQGREKMVLMTTLADPQRYSADTIHTLYRARWEAETFFREIKTEMHIEAFHTTSPDGILQEIYACLTWMTLFAIIETHAHATLTTLRGPQPWNTPHSYTINRTQLARLIRRNTHNILTQHPTHHHHAAETLANGITHLAQRATKRRPDRHFERQRKSPWGRFRSEDRKGK